MTMWGIAERCGDVTAGTALLSSFYENVTVGLSLCHMSILGKAERPSDVVRDIRILNCRTYRTLNGRDSTLWSSLPFD